jgi:hypothetical protein
MVACGLFFAAMEQPNLKLKTCPKQLLGSLPLAFMLPQLVVLVVGTKQIQSFFLKTLISQTTCELCIR